MGTFSIGRIFGIPIEINLTFIILLGFGFLFYGGLPGVGMMLLLFISVLLHELGHSLVARRLGVDILGIELHFFGGAAKMAKPPRNARDEIVIAAAGPAVSFAIAGVTYGLGVFLPMLPSLLLTLLGFLAVANVMLGTFNLLPALPMDGGRIFRAALSSKLGRVRATEIAVTVARFIAVVMGVFGVVMGHFFLAGLAILLWFMASAELRAIRAWSYQPKVGEVEVLDRYGRPIGRGDFENGRFEPHFFTEDDRTKSHTFLIRTPDGKVHIVMRTMRW